MACVLGYLGAWFIGNYGIRIGIIDVPSERSSHVGIVPKGGGLGILAAFIMCGVLLEMPIAFWIPGSCLAIVSFCGDKFEIKPKYRLIIHFFCCFVFLLFHFKSLNAYFVYYILVFPLAVFITGTLNFYNFMDGINGIAGITGFIGFILLALFGLSSGAEIKYLILSCALSLACAGFLPFNIPQAKVFMGDIGSILLGFVFACLMIAMSENLTHFIVAISFLMPFYVDELNTMLVRIRNGEDLTIPHRKHIYQLLANELDIAHWKISLSYGIIQFFIGLLVLAVMPHGLLSVIMVVGLLFLVLVFISINVRKRIRPQ
jgi:Fuc2NAc and GlcNAc transferase